MAVIRSAFDVPIPDTPQSFPHFILATFERHGDKIAMVDNSSGQFYTYKELKRLIMKCGSALLQEGFEENEVAAIILPNVVEFPIVLYGITAIGGIVTTVNPEYTVNEMIHQLQDSGASYIVTLPCLVKKAIEASTKITVKNIFVLGEAEGCISLSNMLLENDGSYFPLNFVPKSWKEDVVFLPYSSGTTGFPKGVMLTHYNLVAHALIATHESFYVVPEDGLVMLGLMPMFHIYGLSALLGLGLYLGGKIICMVKYRPAAFLECIQEHKLNALNIVPPIAIFLAKDPLVGNFDLSHLKSIMCGGAPLGEDVIYQLKSKLPHVQNIRQGYGMTETSPSCICPRVDFYKPGSVGVLLPNLQAKVIDLENGSNNGSRQIGEICVKGPVVMKGYLNNPQATKKAIDSDGWLHTGDIGYYDDDEHFFIVDRIKDVIKFKGFQVAPAEIEAILLTHPKIKDAAVIGVPNEEAGELPKAFVVRSEGITKQDILHFVAVKVAPYKRLRGGIEFVESIPKNVTGKILRRALVAFKHKL
ncbi:4-coumarate--CoA ligase 1-like isoform X2 [Actinia tenebrosa]|uniref:Luciferin 4-monooxygenase n=1 Tax=Actinia tenebrosa TaxID=6105 RepID=A0A6P8IVS1_ACTTE|nr:4-coumarate--CoA ligase 1-like isoform X2 [Actinia tenebrosa]